jgi:hypothetical protein
MSYKHDEMPPVIRRTATDHYQLEGQSGVVIAEYNEVGLDHPNDWWADMIDAMRSAYTDPFNIVHDLTLLTVTGDYQYIDETEA